jgi:hydrogenase nickel incorporation protein HypB
MCDTCGCNVTHGNRHLVSVGGTFAHTASGAESIAVLKGLLDANDQEAVHNRQHFDKHRVLAVNLMSSPGAGKTALLEATIAALGSELRIAVIEGDLETENDAERIRAKGVPAIQINTGSACHLDAHMIHSALHQLDLSDLDIVFIENVGNLVCPASFDLGQHQNVTLLSTPEGDDKPAKYPVMFRSTDLLLLTKSDLMDVLGDFDPARATQSLRNLANPAAVFEVSSRNGDGMDLWLAWLKQTLSHCRSYDGNGQMMPPNERDMQVPQHGRQRRRP